LKDFYFVSAGFVELPDNIDSLLVALMGSVGEIKPSDVHAGEREFF
jgi:hypothetical protein